MILVGDLNSDKATEVKPGDGLAYKALLEAGFAERSTSRPLGCCLNADVLTDRRRRQAQRLRPQGRPRDDQRAEEGQARHLVGDGPQPVNGFWDSDHAGLFSTLTLG